MTKEDAIELEGIVKDILGGGKYKVAINDMDLEIEAYASGKMKKHHIKIIPGDYVKVELNEYEPTKGRIVYRSTNQPGRMPPPAAKVDEPAKPSAEEPII